MIKSVVRSALVVALTGAVLGLTQTAHAEKQQQQAAGVIKAVDTKAGTITLEHKHTTMTFSVAPDIKFGAKGENVNYTLANLKVGDNVTIHYTDEGGKLIAHKVSRVDVSAKKAAKDEKKKAP
jgi:Cu/Ag efflux protein CusF